MSIQNRVRFYPSYGPPLPNQYAEQQPQTPTRSEIRLASDLKKYKKRSRILAITTCTPAATTLIFGGIVVAAEVITVKITTVLSPRFTTPAKTLMMKTH